MANLQKNIPNINSQDAAKALNMLASVIHGKELFCKNNPATSSRPYIENEIQKLLQVLEIFSEMNQLFDHLIKHQNFQEQITQKVAEKALAQLNPTNFSNINEYMQALANYIPHRPIVDRLQAIKKEINERQ